MKTLTKPEKFRIASPSIYGYCEGKWVQTGTTETHCTITHYYECFDDANGFCCPGSKRKVTRRKH